MNRFDEDPVQALEMLNAKPESDAGGRFAVQVVHKGVVYEGDELEDGRNFIGNPLGGSSVDVAFYERDEDGAVLEPDDVPEHASIADRIRGKQGRYITIEFQPEDFVRFDPVNETFVFQDGETVCILTKVKERTRANVLAF
jgi:hypothetical protein